MEDTFPDSITSANEIRLKRNRHKRVRWKLKEKKLLLSILEEHGHQDVRKIAELLPTKTETEIACCLNRFIKIAANKFSQKKLMEAEQTLNVIHPWVCFMNMFCHSEPSVHNHLIAYVLPLIERYGNHPSPEICGGVDFRLAYRALFSSLVQKKFPDNLNSETVSMMYASVSQLLEQIRNFTGSESENVLRDCLVRCVAEPQERKDAVENITLRLPEVNILNLTTKELESLCKNNT